MIWYLLTFFLFISIVINTWWSWHMNCVSVLTDTWLRKWMPFQVLGAVWYLFAIERQDTCWRAACSKEDSKCKIDSLYCSEGSKGDKDFLAKSCPIPITDPVNTTDFDFGIFLPALQSEIVQSEDFPQKFFYCFWWGLQNLRFVPTEVPFDILNDPHLKDWITES